MQQQKRDGSPAHLPSEPGARSAGKEKAEEKMG